MAGSKLSQLFEKQSQVVFFSATAIALYGYATTHLFPNLNGVPRRHLTDATAGTIKA